MIELLYKELPSGSFDLFVVKFENHDEVRWIATEIKENYKKLNVLVNNASIVLEQKRLRETKETVFGINHLSSFMLTHLLMPWFTKINICKVN